MVDRDQERRRYARYPICCRLEYKAEDNRPKEPSNTINLSESGALIHVARELSMSSSVILKLILKDDVFFIVGVVKHVKKDEYGESYEVGLEFLDRSKNFIRNFYNDLEGIIEYQNNYKKEQASDISLAEASINWYKDTYPMPR